MPTILDAVGIAIPARVQGSSRIPNILKGDVGWKEPVFIENIPHEPLEGKRVVERAVRTERWKLILRDHSRSELYEMAADPAEKNDLFLYPDFAPHVKELARLIFDWGKRFDDAVSVELGQKIA